MGKEETCHSCACEVNEWYRKYLLYEVQTILNNGGDAENQLGQIMTKILDAKVYAAEELIEHGCEGSQIVIDEEWPQHGTCP